MESSKNPPTDGQGWAIIGLLLQTERGRWARQAGDNRRFLNGMLYVLRVGCPWRDMHERYGKWNSVYVQFRRWDEQGGVFEKPPGFETSSVIPFVRFWLREWRYEAGWFL